MGIVVDRHRILDIPVIECYNPETPGKPPVIMIMHGFTGNKEHHLAQAYQAAQNGYYAMSIDLHLHGESGEQPFNPAHVSPRLMEVIEKSTVNLERLVGAFKANPKVDGTRIGLMGISLGGAVINFYLPQRDPAVKAAATMVAGPAPLMQVTFKNVQKLFPQFEVTDRLIAELSSIARSTPFLENVRDFPLLAMFGVNDPLIPIESVRALYHILKHGYAQPDKLHFSEFADTGHETPNEMFLQAAAWFQRYL